MKNSTPHFTPALFDFLRELKANNRREWFTANKARYAEVAEGPMLRFMADLQGPLSKVAKQVVIDPRKQGGSMFRIYRDTRFSKDKTPYKTHIAAHFKLAESGAGVSAPGFYLHLGADECMGGGGVYHPEPGALKAVRDAIAGKASAWDKVLSSAIKVEGDALKRPPAGYDAAHKHIEWLKHKDFFALENYTAKVVCARDFLDRYVETCERIAPLMKFLAAALGAKW